MNPEAGVLFYVGSIPIHQFGLMIAIAFLTANYFFTNAAKARGVEDSVSGTVALLAIVFGIIGSKLFHLLENPDELSRNVWRAIFSGGGLTFYGGLILAVLSILIYLRSKRIPFLRIADSAAPALILAYGIGRLGCHFSGDGDYGIPSDLPWAMSYANGVVPTLSAFNHELSDKFQSMNPTLPIPIDILVHPTPLYEFVAAGLIFLLLRQLDRQNRLNGWLFGMYLVFAGFERLLVEFIRLNPLYMGLSQAQWISIGMITVGVVLVWFKKDRRSDALSSRD